MKRKFDSFHRSIFAGVLLSLVGVAWSAEVPVATVNNVKIGAELMVVIVNNVAQGVKDSPELRAALKTELIAREVLAQEAKKQNLDKDTEFKTQMLMQQNTLLVERLITNQFEKL